MWLGKFIPLCYLLVVLNILSAQNTIAQKSDCQDLSMSFLDSLDMHFDTILSREYQSLPLDLLKQNKIQRALRLVDSLQDIVDKSSLAETKLLEYKKMIIHLLSIHDYDRALNVCQKADLVTKELPKNETLTRFYLLYNVVLQGAGRYAKGNENLDKALNIYTVSESKDSITLIKIYINFIINYSQLSEIPEGFIYKDRAENLLVRINNSALAASYYNAVADLYRKFNQLEDAKCNLLKSLMILLESKDKRQNQSLIAMRLNNLGEVYMELDKINYAFEYHKLALRIKKRISHHFLFIDVGTSLMNKGYSIYRKFRLEDSINKIYYYFDTTIYLRKKDKQFNKLPEVYNYYVKCLLRKNPDSISVSFDYLKENLIYLSNRNEERGETLRLLFELYSQIGQNDSSLKYLELLTDFDSSYNSQKEVQYNKFLKNYESNELFLTQERKYLEFDIDSLHKEKNRMDIINNKLNDEKLLLDKRMGDLRRNLGLLVGGLILIILLLIITGVLYFKNRKAVNSIREKDETITSESNLILETAYEFGKLKDQLKMVNESALENMTKDEIIYDLKGQVANRDAVIEKLDQRMDNLESAAKQNKQVIVNEGGVYVEGDLSGQVITSSSLKNTELKLKNTHDVELMNVFKEAVNEIQNSSNKQAISYLNLFTEEYNQNKPDKNKLVSYWGKIEKAMSGVGTVIDFGAKIADLFM